MTAMFRKPPGEGQCTLRAHRKYVSCSVDSFMGDGARRLHLPTCAGASPPLPNQRNRPRNALCIRMISCRNDSVSGSTVR
jgi:hypothetical protein